MTSRSAGTVTHPIPGPGAQQVASGSLKSPELAEGFVLLDNSTSREAVSELFENPVEIIRADSPEEVDTALSTLTAALARGLHAAAFSHTSLATCSSRDLCLCFPASAKCRCCGSVSIPGRGS